MSSTRTPKMEEKTGRHAMEEKELRINWIVALIACFIIVVWTLLFLMIQTGYIDENGCKSIQKAYLDSDSHDLSM